MSANSSTNLIPAVVGANVIARRLSYHSAGIATLENEITEADVVVTSMGKREYILGIETINAVASRLRGSPYL